MAYCPRFKSYKDVQQWLERVGAEMARARGVPPPKVAFLETIYVGGKRHEVPAALYDYGTETIVLHPGKARRTLEPTSFMSWRFGILRDFYHEFKHHEQFHRAGKNPRRAFDEVELKKPWGARKHEKEADKESDKLWARFDETLDPTGILPPPKRAEEHG